MQMILTHDNRPLIQHLTVDEAIGILRAFGWYPLRAPKPLAIAPASPTAPHRPEQPSLALDVPPAAPAAPAASAPSPVASPAPATEAPHGVGVHPAGPEELAQLVRVMCEVRSAAWLARKLKLSPSQVNRMAKGTRGASPLTLEKLHALAVAAWGVSTCRDYDWAAMKAACAARAHNLPKAWRQTTDKPEGV